MPCSPSAPSSLLHRQAFDQFRILAFEQFDHSLWIQMKLTHRIATVHTNQHDHIPLAYRQFTKLPSYVISCMMLHDDVYYCIELMMMFRIQVDVYCGLIVPR